MVAFLDDLRDRLGEKVESIARPNDAEVYIQLGDCPLDEVVLLLTKEYSGHVVSIFAEDLRKAANWFLVHCVMDLPGYPQFLVLSSRIAGDDPQFRSLSADLPALNWQEREMQDWFGIKLEGHPNPRRVALHDNWPAVNPLRKDFPIDTVLPPFEGERHIYRPALGEGVFQVPVGPVHAGIIEPGHFSFAVAGEPILYLQLRMFYTHKGTEKRFEGLSIPRAVFLAESISGDSSFSHGTAFCQAVERACDVPVPPLALRMRCVLLEMERVYNHVADIGAIATDVGFVIANSHAGRLRERLLATNEHLTGSRLLRGMVCIGGVRRQWNPAQVALVKRNIREIEVELALLVDMIHSSDSTRDRLETTGFLHPDKAKDLGIVGVGGRASGIDRDVRRDHPYAAYSSFTLKVPCYQGGDVWHRMQVRIDEIHESVRIIRVALDGEHSGDVKASFGDLPPGRCALGAVEGWRGEIIHWIRTGPNNSLERCKIKDPSLNNWPALVEAVQGNIIADFPVINKSFNLSYSGTDR
jgi:Ni,Fe-hydrogenase III large subunit/Ni,Fe-hydrogenase III component G